MILITGGMAQGKREFVCRQFSGWEADWAEGERDTWEHFREAPFCCDLHLMIRRKMTELDPEGRQTPEELAGLLADQLLEKEGGAAEEKILITDEIGCGIVPLDPFERRYRECVGRTCCILAQEAREVWRVVCGLGQKIK